MFRNLACGLLLGLALSAPLVAGDWPQILGPNRDGTAVGEQLPARLPAKLELEWEVPVGSGFAGPAVAGDTVFSFHREDGQEAVYAIRASTGVRLWRSTWPATYQAQIVPNDGPLCVPLVHDGKVYLFGAAAQMKCVDIKTGKLVWTRDLKKDYRVQPGYFGSGSSPIVSAGRLLVNVGGNEAGIVALDPATGETLWKLGDYAGSYSSPIEVEIGGKPAVVFITRLHCVGVDSASGKELFNFPFGARGPTVNGASPLLVDGHLFLTASYGIGAVWTKLGADGATQVWANNVMSSQYPTPNYYQGGNLYGVDGRQDSGVAALICMDPKTGKVHWRQEGFGMAVGILAGDRILLLKTDGTLELIQATPEEFRSLGSTQVSDSTCRALPALANGKFYFRDEEHLKCFSLGSAN